MLLQLVEQTCVEIDRLDVAKAMPQLAAQIGESAGDSVRRFLKEQRQQVKKGSEAAAGVVLAGVAIMCVKAIPGIARQLLQRMNDGRVPAARRCGVATVLAYLVQPHDVLHDTLPAGYGYLDDAILLRAGLVQYLDTLPKGQPSAEAESHVVGLLISLTPVAVRPLLQQAVATMSLAVQVFSMMEPAMAEFTIAQIVANPLQLTPPAAPPGFSPQPVRSFEQGFWGRSGAYIEGENIIMPGGGGLINGQVFIP